MTPIPGEKAIADVNNIEVLQVLEPTKANHPLVFLENTTPSPIANRVKVWITLESVTCLVQGFEQGFMRKSHPFQLIRKFT